MSSASACVHCGGTGAAMHNNRAYRCVCPAGDKIPPTYSWRDKKKERPLYPQRLPIEPPRPPAPVGRERAAGRDED